MSIWTDILEWRVKPATSTQPPAKTQKERAARDAMARHEYKMRLKAHKADIEARRSREEVAIAKLAARVEALHERLDRAGIGIDLPDLGDLDLDDYPTF